MTEPEEKSKIEMQDHIKEKFDTTITAYMKKYKISQGVGCVTKGDEILVHSGYGTDADTIFRIASITKMFTRVAIMQLVEKGHISLDTPAFPLLELKPLPGEEFNPQLNQITIVQLINHQAGWDQEVTGDITFQRSKVAQAVNTDERDVTPTDMVRYMLSKPLQYEPGTKERVYCNFGYSVLGRVIEKISSQTYIDYIRSQITSPLGLDSIQLAYEAKEKAYPNEATYEKDSDGNSNWDPYKDVPLEMADSYGGLVSNSRDLAKFLNHYWRNGYPRHEQLGHYFNMFGRCAGTLAMAIQRRDGTNVVVLFNNRNNRDNGDNKKDFELRVISEQVLDKVIQSD